LLATASNQDGEAAALYQTVDSGATWQLIAESAGSTDTVGQISADTEGGYTGLVFTSPRDGWLTVLNYHYSSNTLLHTTDGGKTWNEANVNLYGCDLSGWQFFAPHLFTFLAYCDAGDHAANPQVYWYRTSDNGATWQRTTLPTNVIVSGGADSFAPQTFVLNATTSWLVGEDADTGPVCCGAAYDLPTVFQTLNSGKTWTKIAPLPDALKPPFGEVVPALNFDFVDDQTGWVIDHSGGLLATTDAGKTWTPLNPVIHAQ
jgi:photosystem II stability/assembly factor-like uncharacterized protein